MSNHTNYNQMYNSDVHQSMNEKILSIDETEINVVPDVVTDIEPDIDTTENKTDTVVENEESAPEAELETVTGRVINCTYLNVRKNPDINTKALCTIRASEKVAIEVDNALVGWYHVHTASGVEGYCMAQYIEI